MKTLIAAVLSLALIGLTPNTAPPQLKKQDTPTPSIKTAQAIKQESSHLKDQAEVAKPVTEPVQEVAPAPAPVPPPPPVPSTKSELMAAAGIPTSDWAAVDYIVNHESTWNPTAVNASSGSCGLVQELPCGKSGCTFGDGVCQLRWATQYATTRYGSWWGAHSFWSSNRWW